MKKVNLFFGKMFLFALSLTLIVFLFGCSDFVGPGETSSGDSNKSEEMTEETTTEEETTGEISGIVTIGSSTSKPLEGVSIAIKGREDNWTTDEEGTFSIKGLDPARYSLVFRKDGYMTKDYLVDVFPGKSSAVFVSISAFPITQDSSKGTVKGVLVASVDIAGAIVRVEGLDIRETADSEGFFVLADVPAGRQKIVAEKIIKISRKTMASASVVQKATGKGMILMDVLPGKEWIAAITEAVVIPGATVDVGSLTLAETGAISGTASLQNLTDYTGVHVFIPGTSFGAWTDNGGKYIISYLPAGSYLLRIEKDGYQYEEISPITVESAKTTDLFSLELVLEKGTVSGVVILADQSLETTPDYSGIGLALRNGKVDSVGVTGVDGGFLISSIPPGNYSLTIAKVGYITQKVSDVEVVGGENSVISPVTLIRESGSISGRAIFDQGEDGDNSGISVSLSNSGGTTTFSASTNKKGKFSITGIPPGEYILTVSERGYSSSSQTVAVLAGQDTAAGKITLYSATGTVEGTVTLQGQADHADIVVAVDGSSYQAVSKSDGSYVITNVPPGMKTLVASKHGFRSAEKKTVELSAGSSATADMTLIIEEGMILVDVVWTIENSPYYINDDLTVEPGATLTIEPGVVVKIAGKKNLVAEGTLIAQGALDNFITFTRKTSSGWGNIKLLGDNCVLKYAIVEYSESNDKFYAAVSIGNSTATVANSLIRNNRRGVATDWSSSSISPLVKNNTIVGNKEGGIESGLGNMKILNNIVYSNGWYGIAYTKQDLPLEEELKDNNSWGNSWGNDINFATSFNSFVVPIGNMSVDPEFVDYENGDYHLKETSPCLAVGEEGVQIGMYGE